MIKKYVILIVVLIAGCFSLLGSGSYANVQSKTTYPYFLYLPEGYDKQPQKQWPLIIYLHGGGLRGEELNDLQRYGLPRVIAVEKKELPFVVVAPQCRQGLSWDREEWFEPFFAEVKKAYRVDTQRVYLTGSSMGGQGTYFLAEKYPVTFAALAPMCASVRGSDLHREARSIKHIPIWIFHGDKDRTVPLVESELMVRELKRHGGLVELTVFPGLDHSGFTQEVFAKSFLYEWFLKHLQSDRYDNGQEKYRGEMRENKKHGKWTYWYRNGTKEREEEYVDGIAHGKWRYWDLKGKECGWAEFTDGTGTRKMWYENGKKEREERFKNGMKDGKWIYWFENGKPESDIEYRDGILHGPARTWFANGQMQSEYHWQDGGPHGRCRQWYESGNLKEEGNFDRGTGMMIAYWDEAGKKRGEMSYKGDKLHGKYRLWNRNGELVREEIYENGRLVSKVI
jgi:antitoxin component YwqK of YwqJK toxin-antitoxin module